MPASSNASTSRPRNAGPEPARAVAASNSRSSRRTTAPISENQSSTCSSAAVSAKRPWAKHSVPAQTRTPTFGMKRKTGASSSRMFSIVVVATPAATDATAFCGVTSSETSRSTRSTSIGLTEMTTMSLSATSSAFEAARRRPWRSARRAARPEPRSVTITRPARSGSARIQPSTIAWPCCRRR